MAEETPEEMIKILDQDEWDFVLVIVDDQLEGCGVYRTKEGLLTELRKYKPGCSEKVQLLTCIFDD